MRLKSLNTFPIFSKVLTPNETTWFVFLYLADSNEEVRNKAKLLFSDEGIFDSILGPLQAAKPASNAFNRRQSILELCGLPSIEDLGITVTTTVKQDDSFMIPMKQEDPYNTQYYNSDRRKKFANFYGLAEPAFQRASNPLTVSVLKSLLDKYEPHFDTSMITVSKKNPWVSFLFLSKSITR